jgi:hypothetical protein
MKFTLTDYLAFALAFVVGFLLADVVLAGETCERNVQFQEITDFVTVEDVAPQYLKDATITVKLANGKEHTFSANGFKVVKRTKEKPVLRSVAIETNKCVTSYKNRVSVLVGHGVKDSLDRQASATQVDVSNTMGAVLGAQYQRSLTDKLSLGVQVQSNKTNSLMLGLDF